MSRAGFIVSTFALRSSPRRGQQTFRTHVDLVHFGVAVTDKPGGPITGLTADDFEIKEAGKPQTIKFFAAGDPDGAPPLHHGFLLDASGSMEEDIKDVRTAAIKFLNTMEQAGTSRSWTSTRKFAWRATREVITRGSSNASVGERLMG